MALDILSIVILVNGTSTDFRILTHAVEVSNNHHQKTVELLTRISSTLFSSSGLSKHFNPQFNVAGL
jgi:hypothetical protein